MATMGNFLKVVTSLFLFLVSTLSLVVHKCSFLYLIYLAKSKTLDILSGYFILTCIFLLPQCITVIHMLWNISILTKPKFPVVPPLKILLMDVSVCILEPTCLVGVLVGLPSAVPPEFLLLIAPLAFAFPLFRIAFKKPKVQKGEKGTTGRTILPRWTWVSILMVACIVPCCSIFFLYITNITSLFSTVILISAFPTLGFFWTKTLGIESGNLLAIRTSRRIHYIYVFLKIIFTMGFVFLALCFELKKSNTSFHEAYQNWTKVPTHVHHEQAWVIVVVMISACCFMAFSFLALSFCQQLTGTYIPSLISLFAVLGISVFVRYTSPKNVVPFFSNVSTIFIIFFLVGSVAVLYACSVQWLSCQSQALMVPYDQLFNDYFWNFLALDLKVILSTHARHRTVGQFKVVELETKSVLFVCATMYKEEKEEMRTLVKSLHKLAISRTDLMPEVTLYFHIVFDGGCQGKELSKCAKKLLVVLREFSSMEHSFYETPYGMQYRTDLLSNATPLTVHFKDNSKFKCKKRWSQAMYMQYILNFCLNNKSTTGNMYNCGSRETMLANNQQDAYFENICEVSGSLALSNSQYEHCFIKGRSVPGNGTRRQGHQTSKTGPQKGFSTEPSINIEKPALLVPPAEEVGLPVYSEANGIHLVDPDYSNSHNTFVLALDGDIEFEPEAVQKLYSKCRSDATVGGVCGRTYPRALGSSRVTVWYQKLEYCQDFWLAKNSQNVFGSVTCCPGCFAMFRASALKDILDKLCEPTVTSADVYLKDIGEDRWITSLMIFNGWNVNYDCQARNWTYCPISFPEFMRQRKRWILSDLSNDLLLLSKAPELIRKKESFSGIFTLHLLMLFAWKTLQPANMAFLMSLAFAQIFNTSYSNILCAILIMCLIAVYVIFCFLTSATTVARITVGFGVVLGILFAASMIYFIYITSSLLIDPSPTDPVFYILVLPLLAICELIFGSVFHPRDMHYLRFWPLFIVYTPTALMLLIINSICGIGDQRWGTRDGTTEEDSLMCHSLSTLTCCRKGKYSRILTVESDSGDDSESEELSQTTLLNLVNMADDPKLAKEAEFWNELGQTTLGTGVNLGTDPSTLAGKLNVTRRWCLLAFLLANAIVLVVQSVIYTFTTKDIFHPSSYIFILPISLALLKTFLYIIGMAVHHLYSTVRSIGVLVYGSDFQVWQSSSSSLSVSINSS